MKAGERVGITVIPGMELCTSEEVHVVCLFEELKAAGFSHYKINQMVDDGTLLKLNKKYYENTSYQGAESDFYYVPAYGQSQACAGIFRGEVRGEELVGFSIILYSIER